jgi:hypothetical protein
VSFNDENDHGARRYKRGCRCDICREANCARSLRERRARYEMGPPAHVHGTYNGYMEWGCRCRECKDANRDYHTAQTRKRSSGVLGPPPRHGTITSYQSWGCRCDECVAGAKAYRAAKRAEYKTMARHDG